MFLAAAGRRGLPQASRHFRGNRLFSSVVELSNLKQWEEFQEGSAVASVVYFTASWCGPCRQIAPVFEELSKKEDFDGVDFVKIDVDVNPDAAVTMGIRSVPTFCFMNQGQLVERFSGADPTQLAAGLAKISSNVAEK
uniref:Thioredoxin domain-containing protein n=1 Tax=Rhizochromulina marina TaxID=1034831 RepID=A0A7S2WS23_9STRA|mmetsp:Transcript_32500/g.94149  ORF Transcript_32500/g.94149 Transcript_32500/m.94149 type:complete len:138 (+) Transcript_32500:18-431(+)